MAVKLLKCALFSLSQNCGISIRVILAKMELKRKYQLHPDIDLFVRLSSWHETTGASYQKAKKQITEGQPHNSRRRYKVIIAAQETKSDKSGLGAGGDFFIQLNKDFKIRRAFAVWLSPDAQGRTPFKVSPKLAKLMATRRHISALAIDSQAVDPSKLPVRNSINARMLCDLLFRN